MTQRSLILNQYGPLEKVLLIVLWTYDKYIGRRIRELFELKGLMEELESWTFDVQRVGHKNVFSFPQDSELGAFRIGLRRRTSDIPVFRQVFVQREYRALIERIHADRAQHEIRFIVDAGANVGCSTVYFKKTFPDATIVSIEPQGSNFQALTENIALNDFTNVIPLNAALWVTDDPVRVEQRFRDRREWSFSVTPSTGDGPGSVEGVSIAGLVSRFGVSSIDVLKIDIEGAERFIFENDELVRPFLPTVRYLAMELHDEFNIKQSIIPLLERFGFSYGFSAELLLAWNPRVAS